jgi:hypothetical protein
VGLLYIPLAVGRLLGPAAAGGSADRGVRLAADGIVAASALLFASWVTVIEPVLSSGRSRRSPSRRQVAYPLGDVFVAAMVFALLPRVRTDLRPFLNWVAAGVLLIGRQQLRLRRPHRHPWRDHVQLARHHLPGWAWSPSPSPQAAPGRPGCCRACDDRVRGVDRNLPYVPVVVAVRGRGVARRAAGRPGPRRQHLRGPDVLLRAARQALLARDPRLDLRRPPVRRHHAR